MTLASALRFSGFRKRSRDLMSDQSRFTLIERAFEASLVDIERERVGLGQRIDEVRGWVGGLLGTDDGILDARHPDAERELVEAESQLLSGVKRLAELGALRDVIEDLASRVTDAARRLHPVALNTSNNAS